MKNKFIFRGVLVLLALISFALQGQAKNKFNISEEYEVTTAGTAKGGTKFVKIMAYGKNTQAAMQVAKMDAVAAALFRGLPGSGNTETTPPIMKNGEADYYQNKDYFDRFFGEDHYLQYVNFTNRDVPTGADNLPTKKGQRVGVYLQIMWDNLYKQMINDGMATPLAEQVGGGHKPIIMVIPETANMKQHGFVNENGQPDFRKALDNDNDLRNCIAVINDIMKTRGYPLASLEQKLNELDNEEARQNIATTKGGSELQSSDLDELSKIANADIFIALGIEPHRYNGVNQYSMRLTGQDASSLKDISGKVVESTPSAAPASMLLKECLLNVMDGFTADLEQHFDDVVENGREGTVFLKLGEDAPMNFETEVQFNGERGELQEVIDYWMGENAVKGAYNKTRGTETTLVFEQVRMPIKGKGKFGKKEKALDVEDFARRLARFLEDNYGFSARVDKISLGKAYVYLGSR